MSGLSSDMPWPTAEEPKNTWSDKVISTYILLDRLIHVKRWEIYVKYRRHFRPFDSVMDIVLGFHSCALRYTYSGEHQEGDPMTNQWLGLATVDK